MQRNRRNKILALKLSSGEWCHDKDDLKEEAVAFYKNLFAKDYEIQGHYSSRVCFPMVPHSLPNQLIPTFLKGFGTTPTLFGNLSSLFLPPSSFAYLFGSYSNSEQARRNLTLDAFCYACRAADETALHLLRDCSEILPSDRVSHPLEPPLHVNPLARYLKRFVFGKREHCEVLAWRKIERRNLGEGDEGDDNNNNSSLILAERRTHRKDPLNDFNGSFLCRCCSLVHLIRVMLIRPMYPPLLLSTRFLWLLSDSLCTLLSSFYSSPLLQCNSLYACLKNRNITRLNVGHVSQCRECCSDIGQGEFHARTTNTLNYVVHKADVTAENLRNASDYLSAAKKISVDSTILSPDMQKSIADVENKISSSASTLSTKAADNKDRIQHGLDGTRLELYHRCCCDALFGIPWILALGSRIAVSGLHVIFGWILVAGTFILCGVFNLLHNVTGDACVAMDEWVQHPTAHTALNDILPCVDNATAQETLLQTKNVSHQLVNVVNGIINDAANRDLPPELAPLYYNQSGPMVPILFNPFHSDLTERMCTTGEVSLFNSSEVTEDRDDDFSVRKLSDS
ncbi:PLATZ transcription factor family protein [Hibiscus syriacus]|uniref:PLATZ transcription factor family protein n=1 Tax=Hibiscus syriacus TaxID=106335 RepID=A0A6A3ASN2_HIBSY|nr:PLATZ transcription factor family protein [Hibiscus syriacus]